MDFLSNTIESYKGIAEDREKIDELMFSDEEQLTHNSKQIYHL